MVVYSYKCDNCDYTFEKNYKVTDRNLIVGEKCPKCEIGNITRSYNIPNFTFDMNNKCPSDLKLVINKLKDKAKLDSIIDEDVNLDER